MDSRNLFKKIIKKNPKLGFFLLMIFLLTTFLIVMTCSGPEGSDSLTSHDAGYEGDGGHQGLIDKIHANSRAYFDNSTNIKAVVKGSQGKLIKVSFQGKQGAQSFLIEERKSKLKSCNECHTLPLAAMKAKLANNPAQKKAHWEISLKHASAETMNCTTCHNSKDIDNLRSLTGKSISFNKSYQLCAQCHSPQFKDWQGGAHGKKVANWAPNRKSMSCVECHNPHSPSFEKRWPSRFNQHFEIEER